MSGNLLAWKQGLLSITADVTIDDASYAPSECWSIPSPDITQSYISVNLATISGSGKQGISITGSGLPGQVTTQWTLQYIGYQGGIIPSPLIWNEITITEPTINITLSDIMPTAYYRFRLLANDNGKVIIYSEQAISTPSDTVFIAVGNIFNDDVLSRNEKPVLIQNYQSILNEQINLDASAVTWGITTEKTAYDTAISSFTSALSSLTPAYTDLTQDTPLGTGGGANLRTLFQNITTKKSALQTKIDILSKTNIDNTNTVLSDIANDGKITDQERPQGRTLIEGQRQAWMAAYDSTIARGLVDGTPTTSEPWSTKNGLWRPAYNWFASIFYLPVAVTNNVSITINPTAHTIVRNDTGSFITDGFLANQYCYSNPAPGGNMGCYLISSVTASTLTCTSADYWTGTTATLTATVLATDKYGSMLTASNLTGTVSINTGYWYTFLNGLNSAAALLNNAANLLPASSTQLGTVKAGSNITIASDGTISSSAPGVGTVTNVTATSPLFSTNPTSTPNITIQQSNTSQSGYLSNTDWNTFNNKQAALGFTPYNATNPAGYITSSGTIALANDLTGGVGGNIPYQTAANSTSFLATGSGVLVGGSTPSWSAAPTLTGTNFTGIPESGITNLTTDLASKVNTSLIGANNGIASLDSGGKVPTTQLPAAILGSMNYQGTWNASTNTPTLTSSVGTKGYYYKVATAGTTSINGNNNWTLGDLITFDGTVWEQIQGGTSDVVSVFGRVGAITLTSSDVTSALTYTPINKAGDTGIGSLTSTGTITADSFNGPGSGLTIPSGSNTVSLGFNTLETTAIIGKYTYKDHLQFYPPQITELNTSGTWSSTTNATNIFCGEETGGAAIIPSANDGIRFTWTSFPYCYLNYLYSNNSTSGNNCHYICETSTNGTTWTTEWTGAAFNNWPGTSLDKYFITTSGKPYFRLTLTRDHTNTNDVAIYKLSYLGGYGQYLPLYTTDINRNITFNNSVTASQFNGSGAGLTGTAASLTAGNSNQLGGINANHFISGTGTAAWGLTTTNLSGASNQGLTSGFYDGSDLTDMPTADWYHLINSAHSGSYSGNQYQLQIIAPFWTRNNLYFRTLDSTHISGGWNEIYHSGNLSNNAAAIQAVNASINAPMVGTNAQMGAFTPISGSTPYWYATDITAPDGMLGTLYHWSGSSWVSVGNPSAIIGRLTAGVISAGAIGAQALAATIVISNLIESSDYTQDGSGNPTAGFKLDSSEPTYKLKVGAGQFGTAIKIGASSYTLGDTSGRALTGIAASGSSATDVIWWRGNDDPTVNGGTPIIIDPLWALDTTYSVGDRVIAGYSLNTQTYAVAPYVYECTTAGAGLTTTQSTSTAYSSATTYTIGQLALYANYVYQSISSGNLNHTPVIGGTAYWTDLGNIYGPQGTVRTTDSMVDGAAKWKCIGWMYTSNSTTGGLKPWARSTSYSVGTLVCSDVGTTYPGYIGTNEKLYGQPTGPVFNPAGAFSNFGGTRIYRCSTAGTSASTGNGPSGTTTGIADGTAVFDYWAENTGPEDRVQIWGLDITGESMSKAKFEIRIQPKTNTDNLDALTHIEVEMLDINNSWKGRGTYHWAESVSIPSRKYYSSSTPAHINNMIRVYHWADSTIAADTGIYINASPYAAQAHLQVCLHNVYGSSVKIPYVNWGTQNIVPTPYSNTLTAAPTGGGGLGGGGYCPEPWVLILTERGEIPASEIVVGDTVSTKHETTGEVGIFTVSNVEPGTNETALLVARKTLSDGSTQILELAFALNHRFKKNGEWVELKDIQVNSNLDSTDGSDIQVLAIESRGINDVVKITVENAHTYSTSGILSHNVKILN